MWQMIIVCRIRLLSEQLTGPPPICFPSFLLHISDFDTSLVFWSFLCSSFLFIWFFCVCYFTICINWKAFSNLLDLFYSKNLAFPVLHSASPLWYLKEICSFPSEHENDCFHRFQTCRNYVPLWMKPKLIYRTKSKRSVYLFYLGGNSIMCRLRV